MLNTPALDIKPTRTADKPLLKLALLFASSLTVLAGAIIAPALPAIQAHFAAEPNAEFLVQLVLTLPALFIVIGAPIAGYLVDRIGRKRILVGATAIYIAAGSTGLFVETLPLLLLGRAVLGLAVAAVMTSATTLIADYYTGAARAAFLGLQAAFMGLGGTFYVAAGGVLADVSWRAPFAIYLFALLLLPLLVTALYEPERIAPQPGSAAQVAEPMPVRLMGFIYGLMVLIQIAFYVIIIQLPFHLVALNLGGGVESGLGIAVLSLCFALAAWQFGRISRSVGRMMILVIGFGLSAASFFALDFGTEWVLIMLGLTLGGAGIGMVQPNLQVWLANAAPPSLRGRMLGGFTTAIFLGQFISPLLTRPLVLSAGIPTTFGVMGALLLALAVVFAVAGNRIERAVGG